MFPRALAFVMISVFASLAFAADLACQLHDSNDPSVPLCPSNGSPVLPEFYPAKAVSISDDPGGIPWVTEFVNAALHAQADKPPQFVLDVTEETYVALKKMIESTTGISAERKKLWLSSLTKIESSRQWNWQQDFGQPVVVNGQPQYRPYLGYSDAGLNRDAVMKVFEQCGVAAGPGYAKTRKEGDHEDGPMGGNIEGGPAGSCVFGFDGFTPPGANQDEPSTLYTEDGVRSSPEWDKVAKDICGSANIIQAPSHFLNVGHTDEIFSTVRTGPGECDMAIVLASPHTAIETLNANPDKLAWENPVFEATNKPAARKFNVVYWRLCDALERMEPKTMPAEPSTPARGHSMSETLRGYFFSLLSAFLPSTANAGPNVVKLIDEKRCEKKAKAMTNRALTSLIENDPEFQLGNAEIQRLMDKFKDRLAASFPNCPTPPKIVDLPNLFQAYVTDLGGGKVVVQSALGLHPNPTNMQQFGDTLIVPDPGNQALKDEITSRLQGLNPNFKIKFINSQFAHINRGNIHCSTNAVRYCRPPK